MMANASRFQKGGFQAGGFSPFADKQDDDTSQAHRSHRPSMPSDKDIIEGEFEEKN